MYVATSDCDLNRCVVYLPWSLSTVSALSAGLVGIVMKHLPPGGANSTHSFVCAGGKPGSPATRNTPSASILLLKRVSLQRAEANSGFQPCSEVERINSCALTTQYEKPLRHSDR